MMVVMPVAFGGIAIIVVTISVLALMLDVIAVNAKLLV